MSPATAKPRADAWDAPLSEAQRWAAYARMRRHPWHVVAAWIADEYAVPAPSRTALYRWAARMRKLESAHRIEQAITARDEAAQLAAAAGQDDAQLIEAYKALAADMALRDGDAKAATRFLKMALDLADQNRTRAEPDLKARAQDTKDKALRLAREKFEAAEARLAEARAAIEDGDSRKLDPTEVMARVDSILGRKTA